MCFFQFGNPELNGGGGWGIFNAILGWQNSATYGSVISYNIYWIAVILGFFALRHKEVKGHWPLLKSKKSFAAASEISSEGAVFETGAVDIEKTQSPKGTAVATGNAVNDKNTTDRIDSTPV